MVKLTRLFELLFLFVFLFIGQVSAQNGTISGRVYDPISNEPLGFATILIRETPMGTYSDSLGNYEIKNLNPGEYNIEARYTGYKTQVKFEITITNSRPTELNFALEPEAKMVDEVKIIASPFNKTEESPVSIRTIGVNEIARNPGGNRDISKVIQSLPGVASTVAFRNDIIIRGGAPNENRFYLDGIEVPNINHFSTQGSSGGPVGLINVDFIREVDFYTGAFPVSRGNSLSSVMDIKLKNGREDRIGGRLTLGSSDLGLTIEGPIGKKTTFLVSGRKSYLQWLFKVLALPFLPDYNDFQFKSRTKFDDKNELTVIGLGAIDLFKLNTKADSTDSQRYILGQLPVNNQWNYTVGAAWKHFLEKGFFTVVASRNMLNNRAYKYLGNDESSQANLLLDYRSKEIENKLRGEYTWRDKGFKVNSGINLEYAKYTNKTFNKITTPTGVQTIDFSSTLNFVKYGAFGQASKSLFQDRLILSLGLRLDGNTYSSKMANVLNQASPRFSASYSFLKNFSLNFNTGIYYQLPAYTVMGYRDSQGVLVNQVNDLAYIRSTHFVGGLEYNYSQTGKVSAEGFYKIYDNYPLLVRDQISLANLGGNFGVIGNEPVVSKSKGRSYGIELLAQQKLWKGFFGILAYTWVRSEFTDGTGIYKPSAWDSQHLISLTGGYKFKRNWEIGAKWRFNAGSPYTPYNLTESSLIANWDVRGSGILDYSQLNSKRTTPVHNLDFRIDKKWFFKKWSLNIYLDLQNAYYFKAQLPDYLDVARDNDGLPLVDPAQPDRYLMRTLPNTTGTILPSIGVVIEL